MADPIVEFLNARLDEDEFVATRAERGGDHPRPGPWRRGYHGAFMHAVVDANGRRVTGDDLIPTELVSHIVHQDPRRALDEVEGKRRVMRQHHLVHGDEGFECVGCGYSDLERPRTRDLDHCPALRALASVYHRHPDYRERWNR